MAAIGMGRDAGHREVTRGARHVRLMFAWGYTLLFMSLVYLYPRLSTPEPLGYDTTGGYIRMCALTTIAFIGIIEMVRRYGALTYEYHAAGTRTRFAIGLWLAALPVLMVVRYTIEVPPSLIGVVTWSLWICLCWFLTRSALRDSLKQLQRSTIDQGDTAFTALRPTFSLKLMVFVFVLCLMTGWLSPAGKNLPSSPIMTFFDYLVIVLLIIGLVAMLHSVATNGLAHIVQTKGRIPLAHGATRLVIVLPMAWALFGVSLMVTGVVIGGMLVLYTVLWILARFVPHDAFKRGWTT